MTGEGAEGRKGIISLAMQGSRRVSGFLSETRPVDPGLPLTNRICACRWGLLEMREVVDREGTRLRCGGGA